jgi:hypothetical protein
VRLRDRGNYDFIFMLDDPRAINCFDLRVALNPRLHRGKSAVDIAFVKRAVLVVGENRLVFKLTDPSTRAALDKGDVGVLLASPTGWRQRVAARSLGGGEYELSFTTPAKGVYYLSFEIPSLGLKLHDRSPVILRAE